MPGKSQVMSDRECDSQKWPQGQSGSNLDPQLKDEENGI